jgi:C4-dicarboxylate-specific signal transduction histidine kinase
MGPEPLDSRAVEALLARERIILTARLLPGVVHNISGVVQMLSLPLDLARLALDKGEMDNVGVKLENLRQGLDRLSQEVARLAARSQGDRSRSAEPLDLAQLAGRELDFWRGDLFFKHEITLERDLPQGLGFTRAAYADTALAFNLLVANAVEALRGVDEPLLRVRARREGDSLALEVSDSGPGPSLQLARSMFQPFVGDKGGEHQGLGLFLAAKALEPWGGAVSWLEGSPLTTFRLSLPKN